mmetsp:Transcript_4027/g.10976  ORF Transcript_4027/g.10976 Transcript_4027/m.10976 type:complete len:732 (-) Transcript_4027:329-2524(-)|eukprot:CAMPEP_0168748310 /NCGR_PEP_ID=MMETSP0724-20121128/16109_1 /TAXON_ID=265536 /ORGANISM="Amphiprora sp., Strain CCMP467" /LENGTH=731 /DNA_ID=CAMNT_0008796133 /DNA_START=134 /DNA_END=2329 /DNA_ORIENTATION=-
MVAPRHTKDHPKGSGESHSRSSRHRHKKSGNRNVDVKNGGSSGSINRQQILNTINLILFGFGCLSNFLVLMKTDNNQDPSASKALVIRNKFDGALHGVIDQLRDDAEKKRPFQVLRLDEQDMVHARWAYEGRAVFSWIKGNMSKAEQKVLGVVSVTQNRTIDIEVTAMLATIDMRPRNWKLNNGCAMASWVALGQSIILRFQKDRPPTDKFLQPTCAICRVWGDHLSAAEYARDLKRTFGKGARVFRPPHHRKNDATICLGGKATFARRQRWNSTNWHRERNHIWKKGKEEFPDERDSAHGFVWAVWCQLPNTKPGVENNLTSCKALHPTSWNEQLQSIYYTSSFQLPIKFTHGGGAYRVRSRFPWQSFVIDLEQYRDPLIPPEPKSSKDLYFLWAEGPLWSKQRFKSQPDDVVKFNLTYSITLKKGVPSAIGPRFILSILQQATIAPNSTRIIAVLDSQARSSIVGLNKLLDLPLSTWFPVCGETEQPYPTYDNAFALLYTGGCFSRPVSHTAERAFSFRDLLEYRRLQIRIVPFPLRAELFGTVRQMGQTAFAAWLGLRFGAEFHALMYMDTDGIPFVYPRHHGQELSRNFLKVLYARLWKGRRPCANQRFDAYEYAVTKRLPRLELRCVKEALLNKKEYYNTAQRCNDRPGHLVARTDSLGMLWIHDNYALPEDMPPHVRMCNWSHGYFFPNTLAVEMHLRPDARPEQGKYCTCYPETLLNEKGLPDY